MDILAILMHEEQVFLTDTTCRVGLAVLAVALAAFCVWLGVRIVNRHERWAKRLAVALVVAVLVGYPLSIGPAVWLTARSWFSNTTVAAFYLPVLWSAQHAPSSLGTAVGWWGSLGVPDGEWVYLIINLDDSTVVFEFPE
jgi:hypothetical protein